MLSDESNKLETCTYVRTKNNSLKNTNLLVDQFVMKCLLVYLQHKKKNTYVYIMYLGSKSLFKHVLLKTAEFFFLSFSEDVRVLLLFSLCLYYMNQMHKNYKLDKQIITNILRRHIRTGVCKIFLSVGHITKF